MSIAIPSMSPESYAARVFAPLTAADFTDLAATAAATAAGMRESAAQAFAEAQAADNPEDRSRLLDINFHDLYAASVADQRAARHTAEAARLGARTGE